MGDRDQFAVVVHGSCGVASAHKEGFDTTCKNGPLGVTTKRVRLLLPQFNTATAKIQGLERSPAAFSGELRRQRIHHMSTAALSIYQPCKPQLLKMM